MTAVKQSNKGEAAKASVLANDGMVLSPFADMNQVQRWRQAHVLTVENSQNPLAPKASAQVDNAVPVEKTVESGKQDLGPTVSIHSPSEIGNPEVPLKEDGK